ncbi:hypothetical protein [Arcticibacterium luteifluviistationis]|uniref:Uncharacterized protein n=1 Tax=Arcticibacterium luteifluviistationis TaxID=1784714 RepID=A0A2Z4GC60_9BACT|nr:hypothetical protein [Arcticibacterium luteifluviistationis]AWV98882.1 hypothetical protein DJ013_12145 [Arcticibacterium luteifluviistationis]
MKNAVYILLFTLLSFCSFGQNLEKIRVVNKLEEIKPGNYFSLFLEVNKNFHNSFPENVGGLKLPEGWNILSEKKFIRETGVRYMYTISTAKNTPSQKYNLEFGLFVRDQIIGFKSIDVEVSENYNIEVVNLKKTNHVLEGDTLITPFLIQNLGNTAERLKLTTTLGTIDFDDIIVEANGSQTVKVTQIIPFTNQSSWQISSDITVFSDSKKPVYNVVSIPVYSDRENKIDNHLRMPITVGVNHLNYSFGNEKATVFRFDVAGRGFLDFDNKHFIDFVANGPNNISVPSLGSYDEYTLSYTYKGNSNVILGDFSNRVSNLLEFGRAGRGIKLEHQTGNSNISLFFQKARFALNQDYAFGASYETLVRNTTKIKLSQITKKLSDKNGDFMSNLVSTSGYFKWKKIDLDAEVSIGLAKGKLDMAIYSQAYYRVGRLRIQNRTIRAGKNYHGFYNNSNFFFNSVNYQVSSKIFLGLNSSFSSLNRSFDITSFSVSPLSKVHSALFTYKLNSKHLGVLTFTNQEREDRLEPASFHYKENFTNISYTYNSPRLEINAQGRFGKSANLLVSDTQEKMKSYASTLQPNITVTPWFVIGGYLEYQHTSKFSADNTNQNLFYYGGNVDLNYKDFIRLNFMYRNNYAPDEFYEKRNFTNASLTFNFKEHSLSLVGARSISPGLSVDIQNTSFFSIKYTVKLNPRLAKNKNIGHLGGKLVGKSEGIPQKGILVKLGSHQTLTDSSGNFHFNNIFPDKYIFTIPPTFELAGIKSEKKTPLEVDIMPDSTVYLEIPLVRTGGVSGELDFRITDKYQYTKEDQSKPIVLAKLTNGEETYVTSVNKNDKYSFKEIKPGYWKLTVYIPGTQKDYEILNNVSSVKVESTKVEMINFTLVSIDRKIQSTGQQFHLSSSNK